MARRGTGAHSVDEDLDRTRAGDSRTDPDHHDQDRDHRDHDHRDNRDNHDHDRDRDHDRSRTGRTDRVAADDRSRREDLARQRFGGVNWGAGFFGWLSANGLNVILLALVAAGGTALGLSQTSSNEAEQNAETIGIVGGIVLLVILAIGYYAGGYVAGRMSRFDGAKQGLAVWIIGLVVTVLLAVAGVVFGSQYNVLSQLNLPRIPVDEGTATTGGVVALVLVLLVTLAAAVLGGKAGTRYHHKVDRAGVL